MNKDSRIFVAGHRGLVGSAAERALRRNGYDNLILKTHDELDLINQKSVEGFFTKERPEYVFLCAAKVGGIAANMASPAQFLYENTMIQSNIINSAYLNGVKKLLFLATSCIYPRLSPQPIREEYLMDGKVEPTNEGYAIAKISGLKMCEMYNTQYGTDYISLMPCNIYGPRDDFSAKKSHVVAALIRRFHEAKEKHADTVTVWGTGNARRELLYVDDLGDAMVYFMNNYSGSEFFNIGTGIDCSIRELATMVRKVVGYEGAVVFDSSKPDGIPQKLLDVSRAREAGWTYKTDLAKGLKKTYEWFLMNSEDCKL